MQELKHLLCQWQLVVVIAMLGSSAHAAFEYQSSVWAGAAANIRVIGDPHLDRYTVNPSMMKGSTPFQLSMQYGRPYDGLMLKSGSLRVLHYVKDTPVIQHFDFFGDRVYSELATGIGMSWSLDSSFSGGMAVSFYRLAFAGLESQLASTLSMSLYYELTREIHFGSSMQHILQVRKALELPQRFLFGVEIDGGPIKVLFSFEKEAALPMELCFGLVSSSKRNLQIACGYRDLSGTYSAGWRIKYSRYAIHYSWIGHPNLPDSHGFGLEIVF